MASNQVLLTRSSKNRMIAGVCGGIAEYFHIDANIVRLIFILLIFADGSGAIMYLLLWVLMPRSGTAKRMKKHEKIRLRQTFGAIILVIGILWFASVLHPAAILNWKIVWSIILLIAGGAVLLRNRKGHEIK